MHIFTSFGYCNRMRFIPEFFRVKTVCSFGNWGKYDEDAIGNVEMDAKSQKAMHSIGFIKQYEEFAVTTRDGGEFRGRRAEITWQHGDGDLIDLSERKWDVFYE